MEPKKRLKETYGKNSYRRRRPEEGILLEGLVKRPVVTVEEFEAVQTRRKENKAFGGYTTRTYLLRGMVFCASCGRRYSGCMVKRRRFPYAYRCGGTLGPVGRPRCRSRLLPGPALEEAVWQEVRTFLENPELFLSEVDAHEVHQHGTADAIREATAGLERQISHYASYRQRAFDEFVRGRTDEETYNRVVAGYQAKEVWLREELARQQKDLERAEGKALDIQTVRQLYPVLKERLDGASEQDKRFVLECLGARAVVATEGITLEFAVPERRTTAVGTSSRPWQGTPCTQA